MQHVTVADRQGRRRSICRDGRCLPDAIWEKVGVLEVLRRRVKRIDADRVDVEAVTLTDEEADWLVGQRLRALRRAYPNRPDEHAAEQGCQRKRTRQQTYPLSRSILHDSRRASTRN